MAGQNLRNTTGCRCSLCRRSINNYTDPEKDTSLWLVYFLAEQQKLYLSKN